MGSDELFDKIRDIIVERLSVEEDKITRDARFIDDLGADSLDIVELIMDLESEFDLEISDEDAEDITTIGDVLEYIERNT